jgi:hypothetical protein
MFDREAVKAQIRQAFAAAEYPGDWCLRGSSEGDEPYLVEDEFRAKTDWRALDPEFLDCAPGGLASALSFFSDEAFRFYLPAYLVADLDGRLERVDPVFYLCYGLDEASREGLVNPRRYGRRTWFDEARHKFAMFTRTESAAIVAYLHWRCHAEELPDFGGRIEQALQNYWLERAGEMGPNQPQQQTGPA